MPAMKSYKSYLLLIFIPYLVLIVLFHTQLQTFDGAGIRQGLETSLQEDHVLQDHRHKLSTHNQAFSEPHKLPARNLRADQQGHNTQNNADPHLHGKEINNQVQPISYHVSIPSNNLTSHPLIKPGAPIIDVNFPKQPHCTTVYEKHKYPNSAKFHTIVGNFIYTAYYDSRQEGPANIRIITVLRKIDRPSFFCHFKTPQVDVEYVTRGVTFYEMCENHGKDYGGWILSCEVPSVFHLPPCEVTISVQSKHTDKLPNQVRIPVFTIDPIKPRQDFGICVPPLFGHIPSTSLIEFIELTLLLGTQHFIFYVHQVPKEIRKVLQYYKRLGIATVINWDLPVREKAMWYHGQLLAINDCLYRGMHQFRHLAFNDIDEFIVPHKHKTWGEMIHHVNKNHSTSPSSNSSQKICGYSFLSAFFDPLLSGTNRALYDLESDLRTKSFSQVRTKVMVKPEHIFELGIHHISKPINRHKPVYIQPADAFIHHYRKCVTDFDPKMNCQIFARDESLSRYIPTLRHNVHYILWVLKEADRIQQERDRDRIEIT